MTGRFVTSASISDSWFAWWHRTPRSLRTAWRSWRCGDIDRADTQASEVLASGRDADDARHLLFLTHAVCGRYDTALHHHGAIGPDYHRRAELDIPALEVCVHAGAVARAVALAACQRRVPGELSERLHARLNRPLGIEITGVTAVPFADHPLTEYFPAFDARVNGRPVKAHIDTGGGFLLMGPARAAALGIATVAAGSRQAHLNLAPVDCRQGTVDRFDLGAAVLTNVPVDVLSSLTGDHDFVIFGTNVLEQFLSTVDYPRSRLLLSPRHPSADTAHRALLPAPVHSMPFHLWSSHYMFARGGFGDRRDLNFFVDSGLVYLHPDGRGGTRQASFTSSHRRLRALGVHRRDRAAGVFESSNPLTLGTLTEEAPLVVVGKAGDHQFGGIRIDGLISHGFLKHWAWTIDFDRRHYSFHR